MREIITQFHPNFTAKQYTDQCLRNPEFEQQLHNVNGGALLENRDEFRDNIQKFRFRVIVGWSESVHLIIGTEEIIVKEKRKFLDTKNLPYKIESELTVKQFPYLTGTISRTIDEQGNGCKEVITIQINYKGDTMRDQIENQFFKALLSHFFLENISKIPEFSSDHSLVPSQQFSDYHFLYDELEELKAYSRDFQNIIEESRLQRKPLVLPNSDQIANITDVVDPSRFSIQDEIKQMKAETDRTLRIVSELKQARQDTTTSSSLPIFILASCAAVVFLVISRSK